MSVSRIDITVPEMLAKAETHGEVEDEIGVRPCLARRGNDRLPKLNVRLRIFVDLKSDLQSFAFEAGRHRQHDIRKRGRGRHEQIGMGVEIERGERGTSANRIAPSEQQIGAEPDQSANRIGDAFQSSAVEVMRGDVVPARRSERAFGKADRGSKPLCRRQVFSGD